MKTTYLIYKQVDGIKQLVVATREEWNAIMKENRGLPMEKRRCFMKDCFLDNEELDCMYIEMTTTEYREWNSKNTVHQRKRKIGTLHSHLSLDAVIADTDVESLHECVPSDFNLERLAMDTVLMGELKQALKAWKPWAEELLELYLAGAKRSCTNGLCKKYKVSDRTIQRWKDAFEQFILNFLKK